MSSVLDKMACLNVDEVIKMSGKNCQCSAVVGEKPFQYSCYFFYTLGLGGNEILFVCQLHVIIYNYSNCVNDYCVPCKVKMCDENMTQI